MEKPDHFDRAFFIYNLHKHAFSIDFLIFIGFKNRIWLK
jgi:hypothetical protein